VVCVTGTAKHIIRVRCIDAISPPDGLASTVSDHPIGSTTGEIVWKVPLSAEQLLFPRGLLVFFIDFECRRVQ
jgi:hypothetical protein